MTSAVRTTQAQGKDMTHNYYKGQHRLKEEVEEIEEVEEVEQENTWNTRRTPNHSLLFCELSLCCTVRYQHTFSKMGLSNKESCENSNV